MKRYIVSRAYDWTWFLLPPLAALVLAGVASRTLFFSDSLLGDGPDAISTVVIGVVIHAHLIAVFLRSHGNPQVFARYRLRFVAVPIVLWLALVASDWLSALAVVVVTFWDVWHSGARTFGLARIYDRNAGNPPALGRRLDLAMSQLLYAGPILAGVTLAPHLDSFDGFWNAVPAHVLGWQRWIALAVVVGGVALTLVYVAAHVRWARAGHRISPHKVFLVASTGLCSIVSWTFNPWGEAFFIMNLFHAVQYLALVCAVERCTVAHLAACAAYGAWATQLDPDRHALWALTIVVSLMHFWYDGFIWSVRAKHV